MSKCSRGNNAWLLSIVPRGPVASTLAHVDPWVPATLWSKITCRERPSHLCWGPRHFTLPTLSQAAIQGAPVRIADPPPSQLTKLWKWSLCFRPLSRWVVSRMTDLSWFALELPTLSLIVLHPKKYFIPIRSPYLLAQPQTTYIGIRMCNPVLLTELSGMMAKCGYRQSIGPMQWKTFSYFHFIK